MTRKCIFVSVFSSFIFGGVQDQKVYNPQKITVANFIKQDAKSSWHRLLTGIQSLIAPDMYSNNGIFGPGIGGFERLSKSSKAGFITLGIITPISVLSLLAFAPATFVGFITVGGVIMGLGALEAGLKGLVGCTTPWYNILGRSIFKSISIGLYLYLSTIPWAISILSVVAGAYMAYNVKYNSHIPGFIYAQPVASLYTGLSMSLASGYINGWALTLYLFVILVVSWFVYANEDQIIKELFKMNSLQNKNKRIAVGLAITSMAAILTLAFSSNLAAIFVASVVLIIMLQACNIVDSLSPGLLHKSEVFDKLR